MIKKSILPIALAMMLLSGCGSDNKEQAKEKEQKVQVKPENQYDLLGLDKKVYTVTKDDKNFKLKQAQGKLVLYDIFATWCPPCRSSATHLSSLQEKYKDNLIIIGLSIEADITDEKLLSFREQNNATYTLSNAQDNRRLADDIVESVGLGNRYPIPFIALYKDGKLINHYIGMLQEEFIESDIKKALEN